MKFFTERAKPGRAAIVAGAALLLALAVAPTAAANAAAVHHTSTRIAILPPAPVYVGEHETLSGRVSTVTGHSVGGVKIGIEQLRGTKWATIARVTTSKTGAFSYYTHAVSRTGNEFRAVYSGGKTYFGTVSRRVTLSVSSKPAVTSPPSPGQLKH